jgi:outer membrane protein assembly factor BamB
MGLLWPIYAHADLQAINKEWAVKIGCGSDSSPAVGADGTIYFGTWDGALWALKSNGTTKWKFGTGVEIRSSPAVGADGTVYFGCRDRRLYAVNPDGKRKWVFKTGGWIDASPAVGEDGAIYFGSWDKSFYAVNSNGSKKWSFQTSGGITSSAAVGLDGVVYFGSYDGRFYALKSDGSKKWEYQTGGPIVSSPALSREDWLCFTSTDGFLYALNFDGTKRWWLPTASGTQCSPVIGGDGTIYLGVNEHMWAITADGKRKWEQPAPYEDHFEASPLVLANGTICHVSRYGMVMNVNGDEPRLNWMFYISHQGYASPGMGPQGTIYASSEGSQFSALKNTVPLARTAWPKFRGNSRNTGRLGDW